MRQSHLSLAIASRSIPETDKRNFSRRVRADIRSGEAQPGHSRFVASRQKGRVVLFLYENVDDPDHRREDTISLSWGSGAGLDVKMKHLGTFKPNPTAGAPPGVVAEVYRLKLDVERFAEYERATR